jgi:hypothetical protein
MCVMNNRKFFLSFSYTYIIYKFPEQEKKRAV